jgi:hypothetical protein
VHFVEVVMADTSVTEALALQAHLPNDEGALLLIEALLELFSLVQSVAT